MQVNNAGMQQRTSSQTNLMLVSSETLNGARCERFIYQALTLPPQIWVRLYDALGKVVEESLSRSDGSLVFRWIYLYDEQGRRLQGNLHNSAGVLLSTCFYDEHEEVTRRTACKDAVFANAA